MKKPPAQIEIEEREERLRQTQKGWEQIDADIIRKSLKEKQDIRKKLEEKQNKIKEILKEYPYFFEVCVERDHPDSTAESILGNSDFLSDDDFEKMGLILISDGRE